MEAGAGSLSNHPRWTTRSPFAALLGSVPYGKIVPQVPPGTRLCPTATAREEWDSTNELVVS